MRRCDSRVGPQQILGIYPVSESCVLRETRYAKLPAPPLGAAPHHYLGSGYHSTHKRTQHRQQGWAGREAQTLRTRSKDTPIYSVIEHIRELRAQGDQICHLQPSAQRNPPSAHITHMPCQRTRLPPSTRNTTTGQDASRGGASAATRCSEPGGKTTCSELRSSSIEYHAAPGQ